MEYLYRVLGIHTTYTDRQYPHMPNYIFTRYHLQGVEIDGLEAVFAYPKNELDSVDAVKKHMERIREIAGSQAVLVLSSLTYRQKEYLLRDRIPFIVEGKQIYLPFMAIYLQQRGDAEKPETDTILPSSQMLLLYYIYNGCGEMLTSKAIKVLSLTPMSVSRAARQLEEMGLLQSRKQGVQKIIYSDRTPQELFSYASNYLVSPVKRTVYVQKDAITDDLPVSGYSALSKYSSLNYSIIEYRACESIAKWEGISSVKMQNASSQYAVEQWRYDPWILSDDEYVDRLSLALSLRNDPDERIEEAVEEMLEQVWRDIDGKRN